jgi:hypothetical protein
MPPLPPLTPLPPPPTPFEFQFKLARQPMLWAAVFYAPGVVAGTCLSRPVSWWAAAGLAFLAAGLYFVNRRKWLAITLALGAFFLAGALHLQLRGFSDTLDRSLEPFDYGPEVEMTAHVTREGRFEKHLQANLHKASTSKPKKSSPTVAPGFPCIPVCASASTVPAKTDQRPTTPSRPRCAFSVMAKAFAFPSS